MSNPDRLVMLGTGDFALPTFVRLLESGRDVVALITQPDRPQGRKQELIPARIKVEAIARGVPVLQPESINSPEGLNLLRGLDPDLLVTAAYGQILSADVLRAARLGGVNLHGSILPAYRGAAPVARAIQNGEEETGVTVIRMTPRVDAGGMIAFARTAIGPHETAGELEKRLAELGAPLVVETLAAVFAGTATVIPQDRSKVTKAPKLAKGDGLIDWTLAARSVHDLVRAMQPWPLASTHWHPSEAGRSPVRLIVHETRPVPAETRGVGVVLDVANDRLLVGAGEGGVELVAVQPEGKKRMPVGDFLRGHRVAPGDRFGSGPGPTP